MKTYLSLIPFDVIYDFLEQPMTSFKMHQDAGVIFLEFTKRTATEPYGHRVAISQQEQRNLDVSFVQEEVRNRVKIAIAALLARTLGTSDPKKFLRENILHADANHIGYSTDAAEEHLLPPVTKE